MPEEPFIIKGVTTKPFFQVIATDEEYCDSYSILGSDDGQEALELLIDLTRREQEISFLYRWWNELR